jgi:hypothetical protein
MFGGKIAASNVDVRDKQVSMTVPNREHDLLLSLRIYRETILSSPWVFSATVFMMSAPVGYFEIQ